MKVKEKKILLADFFTVLRKYFLIILACVLVFGAAGYLLAARNVRESYSASSVIYIQTVTADLDLGITSTDVAIARSLAADCQKGIAGGTDALLDNVRLHFAARQGDRPEENWEDLSVYSDRQLASMITATNEANTQLVTITATAKTAKLAVHLANAVAAEAEVSMTDTLGNFKALPRTSATYATLSRTDARVSRALAFAVIGAVLSYAALLALNFADRRMKRADEANDFADYLPHLGPTASSELLRAGECDTQYEAYNRIRTNLNARLANTECPVIAVSSPTAKEESSVCCENLAYSFARLGRRVLLIDADMRGTAPEIFGEGLGFSDLLEGKDVAPHATDEANLFVLGRGLSQKNPTDLLAGVTFGAALDTLKEGYDIVFINLPPVLGTADAMAASSRLTGTVMTFTLGKTDRREASEALSALYNVGATLLGSVTVG